MGWWSIPNLRQTNPGLRPAVQMQTLLVQAVMPNREREVAVNSMWKSAVPMVEKAFTRGGDTNQNVPHEINSQNFFILTSLLLPFPPGDVSSGDSVQPEPSILLEAGRRVGELQQQSFMHIFDSGKIAECFWKNSGWVNDVVHEYHYSEYHSFCCHLEVKIYNILSQMEKDAASLINSTACKEPIGTVIVWHFYSPMPRQEWMWLNSPQLHMNFQQTSQSLKWLVEREAKEEESAASASVGNDRLLQELWTKRHPNPVI